MARSPEYPEDPYGQFDRLLGLSGLPHIDPLDVERMLEPTPQAPPRDPTPQELAAALRSRRDRSD